MALSRLLAVEADGCQVSRPLRGLQWLLSDCLHAQHGDMGGTWHVKSGRGHRNSDHGPRGEDLGGRRQRDGLNSLPGKPTPSSSTTAALGQARARGENSKLGHNMRPKVDGGLMTGMCWAPRRSTGMAALLTARWLVLLLGAHEVLEEEHVRGGWTPGRQWAAESE
jgi:hypothetical protein